MLIKIIIVLPRPYLFHYLHQSGKLLVLYRMMLTLRALKTGERIVVVSNYTQTLDLIEAMCEANHWAVLRLDGTVAGMSHTSLYSNNQTLDDIYPFISASPN